MIRSGHLSIELLKKIAAERSVSTVLKHLTTLTPKSDAERMSNPLEVKTMIAIIAAQIMNAAGARVRW